MNVGLRDTEVTRLRWEWEQVVPELNTSVFIIPGWIEGISSSGKPSMVKNTKNGEDRLVVLNDIAKGVVEEVRGNHPEFVFSYHGVPILRMNNSAWQNARERVGLKQVRVHDLKHTFGRRLRAAGVSLEDRQDLLGHRTGKITTHYSMAEVQNLLDAANKVCHRAKQSPTLTILRTSQNPIMIRAVAGSSRKSPASVIEFKKQPGERVA